MSAFMTIAPLQLPSLIFSPYLCRGLSPAVSLYLGWLWARFTGTQGHFCRVPFFVRQSAQVPQKCPNRIQRLGGAAH